MERINISFPDEMYQKLEDRKQIKGQKSLAEGIRELVDLGLRIEEAAEKNHDNNTEDETKKLMELLKKNLIWSMETRLLARFLVEKLPDHDAVSTVEILNKYKEKANAHVVGLLGEELE